MRIYTVADIHGKIETIRKIGLVIENEAPDLMVLAGDMGRVLLPSGPLEMLARFNVPIFAVRGNSDFRGIETRIRQEGKIRLLGAAPVEFGNLRFIGLQGTLALPFVSKVCLDEDRRFRQIEPHISTNTFLVAHPPPRGILDQVGGRFHAGSFCFRQFLEKHPPKVVVCGHIHEQAGYRYLNDTLVVNCAVNKNHLGAIIDLTEDMKLAVRMLPNA